jgi:serine/threonine protein kinase
MIPPPREIPESAPRLADGRYVLLARIGRGGMAGVYAAWDLEIEEWRAIKVLLPKHARDGGLRMRFEREGLTMKSLQHPNLVRVYGVGSGEKLPFLVMELINAGSLYRWTKTHGAMQPRMATEAMIQLCSGVSAVHAAGVVHRDIKPRNVLVNWDGVLKLTDFGIAQLGGSQETRTGLAMGTLGFMSPEQLHDAKSVDLRTDIYAIGATLWSQITGRKARDLFRMEEEPRMMDGVPEPLSPVLLRCLSYDRSDRYPSARALSDALAELLPELPEDRAESPPLPLNLGSLSVRSRPESMFSEILTTLAGDGDGSQVSQSGGSVDSVADSGASSEPAPRDDARTMDFVVAPRPARYDPGDVVRGPHPGHVVRGPHPGHVVRGPHPGQVVRGPHPGHAVRVPHPGDREGRGSSDRGVDPRLATSMSDLPASGMRTPPPSLLRDAFTRPRSDAPAASIVERWSRQDEEPAELPSYMLGVEQPSDDRRPELITYQVDEDDGPTASPTVIWIRRLVVAAIVVPVGSMLVLLALVTVVASVGAWRVRSATSEVASAQVGLSDRLAREEALPRELELLGADGAEIRGAYRRWDQSPAEPARSRAALQFVQLAEREARGRVRLTGRSHEEEVVRQRLDRLSASREAILEADLALQQAASSLPGRVSIFLHLAPEPSEGVGLDLSAATREGSARPAEAP